MDDHALETVCTANPFWQRMLKGISAVEQSSGLRKFARFRSSTRSWRSWISSRGWTTSSERTRCAGEKPRPRTRTMKMASSLESSRWEPSGLLSFQVVSWSIRPWVRNQVIKLSLTEGLVLAGWLRDNLPPYCCCANPNFSSLARAREI